MAVSIPDIVNGLENAKLELALAKKPILDSIVSNISNPDFQQRLLDIKNATLDLETNSIVKIMMQNVYSVWENALLVVNQEATETNNIITTAQNPPVVTDNVNITNNININ